MSNNDLNWIANFIWGIVDDVRGKSKFAASIGTLSCSLYQKKEVKA